MDAHSQVVHVTGQVVHGMGVENTCKVKICGDKNAIDLTMNLHVGTMDGPLISSGEAIVELLESDLIRTQYQ